MAATVDTAEITVAQIERAVAAARPKDQADAALNPLLLAQALELAVQQRLVEKRLQREKLLPTKKQLDSAFEHIQKEALAKSPSWEEYLKGRGESEASLRWLTRWRWGWNAYLAEHLNDKVREDFFEAHRSEYDGTEVRASHILFKPMSPATREALHKAREQAQEVRQQIESGVLTFADAAKKYSAGPSAKEGGDLGFLPRRGVMAEEFSKAAFALAPKKVSQPVTSPFGVHLIQITEIRPGEKTWQEVREELEPHVVQDLFEHAAAAERPKSKVIYTGLAPYLDPKSGELVEPK